MSAVSKLETPQRRILPAGAQPLEGVDGFAERDAPAPMQEIEVEPIRTEPLEAALAGRDRVLSAGVVRIHLAYYKEIVTPAGHRLRHDFLGAAVAVHLGRVDERHPELESQRKRCAFPPRRVPCARPWSTFRGRAPARSSRPETTPAATRRSSASPCRRAYRKMWIMAPSDPTPADASRPHSRANRRARRLSARLSGHLRHARHGRGRPCDRSPRRARPSAHRRDALHESRALPRAHVFGRARALPDAARRQQGRGPFRAHLVGRSARHHRGEIRRDRRVDRRPAGHRAVLVRRNDGSPAIRLDGSPLLPSPRRVAPRPDHLRDRRQGRMGRDDRRRDGNRCRAIREQPPDSHLGQQPGHLQPAPVDARAGSEAPWREAHRHRPLPQPDRGKVPRARRAPCRGPTPRSRSA